MARYENKFVDRITAGDEQFADALAFALVCAMNAEHGEKKMGSGKADRILSSFSCFCTARQLDEKMPFLITVLPHARRQIFFAENGSVTVLQVKEAFSALKLTVGEGRAKKLIDDGCDRIDEMLKRISK